MNIKNLIPIILELKENVNDIQIDSEIDLALSFINFVSLIKLEPHYIVYEVPVLDLTGQVEVRLISESQAANKSSPEEIKFSGINLRLWSSDLVNINQKKLDTSSRTDSFSSHDLSFIVNHLTKIKLTLDSELCFAIDFILKFFHDAEKFGIYEGMKVYNICQNGVKLFNDHESDRPESWTEIQIDQCNLNLNKGDIVLTKGNREYSPTLIR